VLLDYHGCFNGRDPAACAGFWLGAIGTGLGIPAAAGGMLVAAEVIEEYGTIALVLKGFGALSFEIGGIGGGGDFGPTFGSES
jgi:hypothetical protein